MPHIVLLLKLWPLNVPASPSALGYASSTRSADQFGREVLVNAFGNLRIGNGRIHESLDPTGDEAHVNPVLLGCCGLFQDWQHCRGEPGILACEVPGVRFRQLGRTVSGVLIP